MGTITIRKVPDEQIQLLKDVAAKNNRSMEAEARSILEEYTAQYVAHAVAQKTNFALELRQFMQEEGIDGFDEEEFGTPERAVDGSRPPVDFGA